MVVGANGATSRAGSSAALRSAADRERFLRMRKSPDIQAILVGHRTTLVEPYEQAPHPLVIFSRSAISENSAADPIVDFLERTRVRYPGKILCEGGISLVHLLLQANLIDTFYLSRVANEGDAHFLEDALLRQRMHLVSRELISDTTFEHYERASR